MGLYSHEGDNMQKLMKKNPRTDADVNLLLTRFRDLQPDGRVIAHADIESTLRLRRTESSYKTAIKHWRQALFNEQRIYIDGRSARGEGFKALTPDEMIRFSNRKVRAAGRLLKKAVAIAASPRDDELIDPNVRLYRARLLSAAEQMIAHHGRLIREMGAALRPPTQLPRTATPAR